ncbi:hypothetical protein LguiB_000845 [Lonicera macranthoides]
MVVADQLLMTIWPSHFSMPIYEALLEWWTGGHKITNLGTNPEGTYLFVSFSGPQQDVTCVMPTFATLDGEDEELDDGKRKKDNGGTRGSKEVVENGEAEVKGPRKRDTFVNYAHLLTHQKKESVGNVSINKVFALLKKDLNDNRPENIKVTRPIDRMNNKELMEGGLDEKGPEKLLEAQGEKL